jgi:hypothetical protein
MEEKLTENDFVWISQKSLKKKIDIKSNNKIVKLFGDLRKKVGETWLYNYSEILNRISGTN